MKNVKNSTLVPKASQLIVLKSKYYIGTSSKPVQIIKYLEQLLLKMLKKIFAKKMNKYFGNSELMLTKHKKENSKC